MECNTLSKYLAQWRSLAVMIALSSFCSYSSAQQILLNNLSSSKEKPVFRSEISSEMRLSVDRGFNYLISQQNENGSFSSEFPVAINSLVGLAFLAGGYTTTTGPYSKPFKKSLHRLLSYQTKDGSGYFKDGNSQMYGHGFATLFLAELYGMNSDEDTKIRNSLKLAVRLIEKSQLKDGGWDYVPKTFKNNFSHSDTSITVCQTLALRAARNLGITVDPKVINRAKTFIQKAQTRDGGFIYKSNSYASFAGSAFPRSAAGVCILFSLGDYDSKIIKKGFKYLLKNYRAKNAFPYYADYYCTQAMFQAGGPYWREYFPYIRSKLLKKQCSNGSWNKGSWNKGSNGGPPQATAMALIILQIPYRYLPIVER